jgi:hypothetical protein
MDLDALALAVDERLHRPAADRDHARLYGVRVSASDIELEELARGEARDLPQNVRPPAGLAAIALSTGAWAAPLDDDGSIAARPSLHPQRWRVHVTTLVGADGVERSVIRAGDGEPTLVGDGFGLVHQRMLRCWSRRRRAA